MTQQWTKAELEAWCFGWCRTPHTTLKAFIDAGFCSDEEPSREVMRLLRQPDISTVDATEPVISRPAEPAEPADLHKMATGIWYRGWECSWDQMAAYWTGDGYFAALGGVDLGCIHVRASTWSDLLDEIDDHPKTGEAA